MSDEPTPATTLEFDPVPALSAALGLDARGVAAVVALLAEGNTVPFIARYRKERTGGLDEVQIRAIEEKREYLIELETRRAAILASVQEQGKLTDELGGKLRAAQTKAELEDLYAPYRPRRKTRASVARDKGLQPLADLIAAQGAEGDPAAEATKFIVASGAGEVATADDALAGARDIVAEQIADAAAVRAFARAEYAENGVLIAEVVPGKADEPTKFEQYYNHDEPVKSIPSHRFLAIRRGEAEGVLRARISVNFDHVGVGIERIVGMNPQSPWAHQLHLAIADALKRLLAPSVENDVRAELKQRSDSAAVDIFAGNLRNLMLAAPLGTASVIGVDPGLRTGCKCAAIDDTGKFLGTVTVYITQGDSQLAAAKEDFLAFVQKHQPRAIAVGNGTGGREAEQFVKKCLAEAGLREGPNAPFIVQVNEAGASVYSASDLAREEFPELDLTIRGAISIARRLQDPLAELVKIEPKSIGVGQYQHDVHQPLMTKRLGDVVEDCVNKVGVELNTASAQLLGYVAGIGKALAKKLVVHRDTNGPFSSRQQLLDVGGLGPKAFEQAAGFLRIANGAHPLDASSVHPERYPLVERMAADLGVELAALIGNAEVVDKIDFSKYLADDVGQPTLDDIAAELKKPGRDPRAEFNPPTFRDDVTTMEDLKQGMILEGVVTNVTAFGAFVDIGVHNDGLVHVSQLSDNFIKDPAEVVKVGDKMTVRVLEVDHTRKRIALSAKRGGQPAPKQPRGERQAQGGQGGGGQGGQPNQGGNRRGNRGGRGRGGGNRQQNPNAPHEGPFANADGGELQFANGDQAHGDQAHGDQAHGGPGGQGQSAQGQSGHAPGGQQQQGERRQWRNRGPGPDAQRASGQFSGDQQAAGGQFGGDQQRGGQFGGDQQQRGGGGPRGGGGGGPRGGGGGQRGGGFPRGDQQRNAGGPRGGGGGGGPRGGGGGGGPRRDDRGPNQAQGRRDDRGPRRDDRGPNQDRGPQREPENWGLAGFTNNPFAKLVDKNNKS